MNSLGYQIFLRIIRFVTLVYTSGLPEILLKIDPWGRIMESTPGYTFTLCVGYFTSTGIDTR